MIPLNVDRFGFLSADADAWLDDISSTNEELTTAYGEWCEAQGIEFDYAIPETIVRFLCERFGIVETDILGIYGENGYASVVMANEETLLDEDISFIFAFAGDNGPFIVENGRGYHYHTNRSVEFRDFIGDDDSDAFGYSHGYANHVDDTGCRTDWILDSPGTLWPNGGGRTVRVSDCILPDDEGTATLVCPDCGGTLAAYVG